MHKVIALLLICVSLVACGKKEVPEETMETLPPPPPTAEHIEDTSVVLNRWGDEELLFEIEGSEAIQSYTDVQIKVLPDVNQFDVVQIDYIQGVSLNDFGKAYWAGFEDETKSDYNNGFTTDTACYRFFKTEKNSTLMISAPIELQDTVQDIYERFGGSDSIPETESEVVESEMEVEESETEESEGGTEG